MEEAVDGEDVSDRLFTVDLSDRLG